MRGVKKEATMATMIKTCECGRKFIDNSSPKATTCRTCRRETTLAARKAAEAKAKAARERAEAKKAEEAYASAIKEAALAGRLPAWAKIAKDDGRQVIVHLPGRSLTFYRPKAA